MMYDRDDYRISRGNVVSCVTISSNQPFLTNTANGGQVASNLLRGFHKAFPLRAHHTLNDNRGDMVRRDFAIIAVRTIFCQPKKLKCLKITTYKTLYSNKAKI